MRRAFLTLMVLAGVAASGLAQAQNWPDKPVRLIVPWPPGGGADFIARTYGKKLSEMWKQPVVIENVAGAGSIVGAERVARAAPDGNTLMLTINGTITGNRFLYKSLPYDPDRSFVPVSLVVQSGQLILASSELKANSLKELVDEARKTGKNISYASYGKGTQPHLLFELLKKREHVDLLHVPYKGLAPVLTALMSNEAQLTIVSPSSASAALATGRVKPLAIGSTKRAAVLPKVPTVEESGFPYLQSAIWFGLFAPAGTPAAVVDKLQRDIAKISHDRAFAAGLEERGFDVVASTPTQFQAVIRDETTQTREMAEAAKIQPD